MRARNKIINVNAIQDSQTGKIIVQKPFPPTTCLAIEGGGSRCLAYVGAYRVAYETGFIDEVLHVSGSSGGSICALAIALGYDPDEAEDALLNLDLERFLEDSQSALSISDLLSAAKTLISVLRSENYSLSSGIEFLEWLRDKVEKKMGNRYATFEDLANKIQAQKENKKKYLYVTGTNVSLEPLPESKIFSHETTPKLELGLAAFMSSCLPGVFPPVKYDGYLWFDGGIMNNLPARLFDDRRFLPPGYDFNDKGLNPCVMVWKVDTKEEISQILYGIVKKIDLNSASRVVTALHNGLSQNTNTDEIREARLTLALSDNGVGVLDFAVDMPRKKDLIKSASKESLEFFENYYNAVYEAMAYPDVPAWLHSLSLEEIIKTIGIYQNMQNKNDNSINEMLKEYLGFLGKYLEYRMLLIDNPEHQFDISIPDFHINIPPTFEKRVWNNKIENGIKEKLSQIDEKMKDFNKKIESMKREFKKFPPIDKFTLLHDDLYFKSIQALSNFFEVQKVHYEEKINLRVRLGLFAKNQIVYSEENRKQYNIFCKILEPSLTSGSNSDDLKIVLPDLPVLKFKAGGYNSGIIYSFDLRIESDRRLYIIASLIYLHYVDADKKDMVLFGNLLQPKINFPRNFEDLRLIFHVDGVELMVMAYRMEVLLHYFEKKAKPKCEPELSIDKTFKVGHSSGKQSKYKCVKDNEGEVMPLGHVIYKSTSSLFKCNSSSTLNHNANSADVSDDGDYSAGYKKPSWF